MGWRYERLGATPIDVRGRAQIIRGCPMVREIELARCIWPPEIVISRIFVDFITGDCDLNFEVFRRGPKFTGSKKNRGICLYFYIIYTGISI